MLINKIYNSKKSIFYYFFDFKSFIAINSTMKKVHIDKMTPRQLEYAFVKVAGMLIDKETAFIKMPSHMYSVYNMARLNISNNLIMVKHMLSLKNLIIDTAKENNMFLAFYENTKATAHTESMALIKCFLCYHTDGYVEMPEDIK
jgi:hypothetical protein